MKKHEEIALRRLNLLAIDENASSLDESLAPRIKTIFLAELNNLGYRIENHKAFNGSVISNYKKIIQILKEKRGGDVDYVPLFSGFPNKVPDTGVYVSSMEVWLGKHIGIFEDEGDNLIDGHILSNGMVVPSWFYESEGFGADSFGRQSDELYQKGVENQKKRESDSHTEWINLRFASAEEAEQEVKQFLANNLYAKSSIKEAMKPDLEYLISHFNVNFIDAEKVVFKETKSYVMAYLWNQENWFSLPKFVSTPTDLLRMFASLTDSDISLAEKIKFPKMNRMQRRVVLGSLDKFPNLAENLNDYKGLWIALGKGLHPGEYRTKFPNAFKAFDSLRNEKIESFDSKVEKAFKSRDYDGLIPLLMSRPGNFARRLHQTLESFNKNSDDILSTFKNVSHNVQLKNLFIMESYFKTIGNSEFRTVINKKGKIIVLPNKKNRVSAATTDKVIGVIVRAINEKMAEKQPNPDTQIVFDGNGVPRRIKVWVDPELRNYTIPLSQRKMSDGLLSYGRGTRIKFDDSKVLRLFTYWKQSEQRTDLDLSLIEFDNEMKYKGHVSYTNLASSGIVHSGDMTSAPNGAAEFIDVTLDKIKKETRYIAPQIYRFAGESFAELENSYAGWSFRDKANKSRKTFDVKTVKHKFNMVGAGAYAIPMIVDLKEREIIFVDLYVNGFSSVNRVENASMNISVISKAAIEMINSRPNMLDLVTRFVQAGNVQMVDNREEADFTYGVDDDCDMSVNRVDEILSVFL
jgi:stress response protein SCP2